MPHVTFVPLTGLRLREERLLELGMTLPGLAPRARAIGQLPALGLLTLAGMLPRGWTCTYLPASHVDDELVESIAKERPTLVAISALTASVLEAYALCTRLRQRGIRSVLGGLHATAMPHEAAEFADSVVVGSGELVWRELVADAASGNVRPIYRAPRHANVGDWPLPRFDLLPPSPPRFTLQTQRGCPLACDFCGASRLLGSFHEKPISAIRHELSAIAAIDDRPLVELADDNTFAGNRDPHELFSALSDVNARYFTECDWRIGKRQDVLEGLAGSGCVQVLVGIESLVFRYPGMGDKQAEIVRIMDAVERIQDAGVAVNGCFIIGAAGETRRSVDRLIQFILDSPLADVQLTLQTPFPGTALYKRLYANGRLLPERTWSDYTLFDVCYQPDEMTPQELADSFFDAIQAVFSPGASERRSKIRRRILKNRSEVAL